MTPPKKLGHRQTHTKGIQLLLPETPRENPPENLGPQFSTNPEPLQTPQKDAFFAAGLTQVISSLAPLRNPEINSTPQSPKPPFMPGVQLAHETDDPVPLVAGGIDVRHLTDSCDDPPKKTRKTLQCLKGSGLRDLYPSKR